MHRYHCPIAKAPNGNVCKSFKTRQKLIKHLESDLHRNLVFDVMNAMRRDSVNNTIGNTNTTREEEVPNTPLLLAWGKVDVTHPLFQEGRSIINEILKSPYEEIPLLNPVRTSDGSMFMKSPQEEHIIADLIEIGGHYVDMTTNTIEETITTSTFLSSLLRQPTEQHLNAIGIPATESGLLRCQPIRIAELESLKPSLSTARRVHQSKFMLQPSWRNYRYPYRFCTTRHCSDHMGRKEDLDHLATYAS